MNKEAVRKRPISDYVALALLTSKKSKDDWLGTREPTSDFMGDYNELRQFAEARCGFKIGNDVLKAALRTIGDCDLIRVSDDQFSGEFYRIKRTGFGQFLKDSGEEMKKYLEDDEALEHLERNKSDFRKAFALVDHELIADYGDFGDEWLDRVLNGLKEHVGDDELTTDVRDATELDVAPASDRIVTLTDNQSRDFSEQTSKIIEEFEKENSVDGDVGVRAKIIGQLKAGRELILSGIFGSQAMFYTLIAALSFLAKRYEKEMVGALAGTLLIELVKII